MNGIAIEKGIPVTPKVFRRGKGPWQTLLASMEVGDSFLVPAEEKSGARNCQHAAKNLGFKLTQRKQTDGSVRIWRIK